MSHPAPIRYPRHDPASLAVDVELVLELSPQEIYDGWTTGFDRWFAAPGSVLMRAEVNAPFFFETEFQFEEGTPLERHPHYGRFLALEPNRRIELTWVTGPAGTGGVETIVTLQLRPEGSGTRLSLHHAGFLDADAADRTRLAWPYVLRQMELRLRS